MRDALARKHECLEVCIDSINSAQASLEILRGAEVRQSRRGLPRGEPPDGPSLWSLRQSFCGDAEASHLLPVQSPAIKLERDLDLASRTQRPGWCGGRGGLRQHLKALSRAVELCPAAILKESAAA